MRVTVIRTTFVVVVAVIRVNARLLAPVRPPVAAAAPIPALAPVLPLDPGPLGPAGALGALGLPEFLELAGLVAPISARLRNPPVFVSVRENRWCAWTGAVPIAAGVALLVLTPMSAALALRFMLPHFMR